MYKIKVAPNKWYNADAIQEVVILNTDPLQVGAVWPTGVQMLFEGEHATEVLKAWDILEDGELPEGVEFAVTAAKLGVEANGSYPPLRPQ